MTQKVRFRLRLGLGLELAHPLIAGFSVA